MHTRREQFIEFPQAALGNQRLLKVVHYGSPDNGPKVYLQAALHADELPGMMVLYKLQQLLDDIDARGEITGRIVIVPVANPIGLAQRVHGSILGRLDFETGLNFNRSHGDLTADAARRLEDRLTDDAEVNRQRMVDALHEAVSEMSENDEGAWLRKTLLALAIDADICLDLHCDNEAVMHMYTLTPSWPRAQGLAAWLGCEGVFLADVSGGHPFDEAVSRPWVELAAHFPDTPLPPAPLSATIELRGYFDVDEALAEQDARHLIEFLKSEGIVDGAPADVPEPSCQATPLAGVLHVRAPVSGLLSHCVAVGQKVQEGDCVARIIDPLASFGDGVTEVFTSAGGRVYARNHNRMVAPGRVVTGIACHEALPSRRGTHLLTD